MNKVIDIVGKLAIKRTIQTNKRKTVFAEQAVALCKMIGIEPCPTQNGMAIWIEKEEGFYPVDKLMEEIYNAWERPS